MRLSYVKLAGFKSFVEPTKVEFKHDMTAIVGPNGCGKSNIIDAVRWVLGESSAKHLRGDSMTDVIFNGAKSRKPVGQASVELVFEKTNDQFSGTLADRQQISIRRVVNRESQNTYYLNGSKCRRKDITDIFLGTGLGPRSYAIIEQGTISRLIESKPQELRVFIEEAAGISKFKERRRETENRIRHTRENLERLSDIRHELQNQLEKLFGQAEAAKRFKSLKAQERTVRAELAVIKGQKLAQQASDKQEQIDKIELEISSKEQALNLLSTEVAAAKKTTQYASEQLQKMQQEQVVVAGEVAKLEQQVTFQSQNYQSDIEEKALAAKQLDNAQSSLLAQQNLITNLTQQKQLSCPEKQAKSAELDDIEQTLKEHQQESKRLNDQWQAVQREKSTALNEQQTYQQSFANLNGKKQQLMSQAEQLNQHYLALSKKLDAFISEANSGSRSEKGGFNHDSADKRVAEMSLTALLSESEAVENGYQYAQRVLQSLQEKEQQQKFLCHEIMAKLKVKEEQKHSIEKLLSDAESEQPELEASLRVGNVQITPLLELLDVEDGWQLAVETVLAQFVDSFVIDDLADAENCLSQVKNGHLFWRTSTFQANSIQAKAGTLAEKVKGEHGLTAFFNQILVAEDPQKCFEQYQSLIAKEPTEATSVICSQGLWLNGAFLSKGASASSSAHKVRIDLQKQQQQLSAEISETEKMLLEAKDKEQQGQLQLAEQKELTDGLSNKLQQLKSTVLEREAELKQSEQQRQLIESQITSVKEQISQCQKALEHVEHELSLLVMPNVSSEFPDELELRKQLENYSQKISSLFESKSKIKESLHKTELDEERLSTELKLAEQNVNSSQVNVQVFNQQLQQLKDKVELGVVSLEQRKEALAVKQGVLSATEQQLNQFHQENKIALEKITLQEQNQSNLVEAITRLKDKLTKAQLAFENAQLKAEHELDNLAQTGMTVESVLEHLDKNASEAHWSQKQLLLKKQLDGLGAINLAAIDEYQQALERKNYLDSQNQDLNIAITTLESAIEKIDKETRVTFKNTFDIINEDLQGLFPKVFGGGSAYLALTEDDMLSTGVTIMARPPGKKNTSIHLLSGGEKALTALSLVFAIFRLNPAPFCMLDEVDAPLDDANVERFCKLVDEMSQTVQFIYISHNKIAMEMAAHLSGVTMFEPGVSRLVEVDIDEALSMAEV